MTKKHILQQIESAMSHPATKKKKILVVDDEDTIREVIRRYLEREDFTVVEASDGSMAFQILEEETPDLIVLDLMLPMVDGLTITRQLRSVSQVPIIMLTAKGEIHDRIHGLELGADDYMVKPFSPRELVLRVQSVLKRTEEVGPHSGERLVFERLQIDPTTHSVSVEDEEVGLTAKEFDLLYFLMRHPKQVFTRDQLLDRVWGYEFYGDNSTVTVHIRRLREKIEADPSNPNHLITVWGVGYKFEG